MSTVFNRSNISAPSGTDWGVHIEEQKSRDTLKRKAEEITEAQRQTGEVLRLHKKGLLRKSSFKSAKEKNAIKSEIIREIQRVRRQISDLESQIEKLEQNYKKPKTHETESFEQIAPIVDKISELADLSKKVQQLNDKLNSHKGGKSKRKTKKQKARKNRKTNRKR